VPLLHARDRSISRARTQVSSENRLTDTNCGRSEKIYPQRTCNWLINSCALRHVARGTLRAYVSLAANEIIHIGNGRRAESLVRERLRFHNCRFLSRYLLPKRLKIFVSFFIFKTNSRTIFLLSYRLSQVINLTYSAIFEQLSLTCRQISSVFSEGKKERARAI